MNKLEVKTITKTPLYLTFAIGHKHYSSCGNVELDYTCGIYSDEHDDMASFRKDVFKKFGIFFQGTFNYSNFLLNRNGIKMSKMLSWKRIKDLKFSSLKK